LSAAEAKTSMTLRIFFPIFRFLLLLLFCFFEIAGAIFSQQD